jgi:hypothetical protein
VVAQHALRPASLHPAHHPVEHGRAVGAAVAKVAHEYGLADEYDSELTLCDWMVAQLLDRLPTGTRLVIT